MYLGIFSPEKYDAFIRVTGEISFEGKEPWEMRILSLQLKDAIAASLADNDPKNVIIISSIYVKKIAFWSKI